MRNWNLFCHQCWMLRIQTIFPNTARIVLQGFEGYYTGGLLNREKSSSFFWFSLSLSLKKFWNITLFKKRLKKVNFRLYIHVLESHLKSRKNLVTLVSYQNCGLESVRKLSTRKKTCCGTASILVQRLEKLPVLFLSTNERFLEFKKNPLNPSLSQKFPKTTLFLAS